MYSSDLNDATATTTSPKKLISVLSVSVFSYRDDSYLLGQIYANPSEFEFQGTIFKFRKRNKISSLLVYVLHKTYTSYLCKNGKEMYEKA